MPAPAALEMTSPLPMSNGSDVDVILARIEAAQNEIDAIYECAPFGSHCTGPDGTFSAINALELSWLGLARTELIGKRKPEEFLTLASRMKLQHFMDMHGRYGFSDLELELQDANQNKRLISRNFNGTLSEEGCKHRARSVSFDMSAIQQSRNQQRIAAISFESLCGTYVTDTNGIILRVNAGFTTLTGYSNQESIGKDMRFLISGFQASRMYESIWMYIAKAGYWQGEVLNKRKDGETITEWVSISAVRDADGSVTNYVGTFYDITAAKASQDEIARMAYHDTLTLLPNRRFLEQRMEHALEMAGRNGLHSALLFVDLDHFKFINDTFGHEAGDLFLIQVGQRMQAALRDGDTVARVGGDEFAVLLEGMGSVIFDAATLARQIGEKLLEALAAPYHIKNTEFNCTASIGICMVNQGDSASSLLTHADLAMYQAKKLGRNTLQFFDPEMQLAAVKRAELEQNLRLAVANSELELHFQPQVDSRDCVIGVEALVRWHYPKKGQVSHADVIRLAEETGLIIPIGKWVLDTACQQLSAWASHPSTASLTMAVNVSARQFCQVDFVETVLNSLHSSGADPVLLNLEVTESLMLDPDVAIAKMHALKAVGVTFSLDDFGTGYSSLSLLTRLPISKLKIDQSFVTNLALTKRDRVVVQSIIALAKSLHLNVIAEGVETAQQRDQLRDLGCDGYQGYLYGKAQPAQELFRTGSKLVTF